MPRYLIAKYNLIASPEQIPESAYPLRVSEKFDGMFALWDGGFSRGEPKSMMPWANRWKDRDDPICTGLWSKDGNVIHAPEWFLDALPVGRGLYLELWAGNGNFQKAVSICRKKNPDSQEWTDHIIGKIFNDDVPLDYVFRRGSIKYLKGHAHIEDAPPIGGPAGTPFFPAVQFLQVVPSIICTDPGELAMRIARLPEGAEGLVCISVGEPFSTSECTNAWKLKDEFPGEGEVIGYTAGDKRLAGKLGSLTVRFNGVTFQLGGGIEDRDRGLSPACLYAEAGSQLNPREYQSRRFPLGTIVEFSYRKLTDDGLPAEARFERIKQVPQ
jgi:hypothetical protein